jgi:hypothetical protein
MSVLFQQTLIKKQYRDKKKHPDTLRENKIIHQVKGEVTDKRKCFQCSHTRAVRVFVAKCNSHRLHPIRRGGELTK